MNREIKIGDKILVDTSWTGIVEDIYFDDFFNKDVARVRADDNGSSYPVELSIILKIIS